MSKPQLLYSWVLVLYFVVSLDSRKRFISAQWLMNLLVFSIPMLSVVLNEIGKHSDLKWILLLKAARTGTASSPLGSKVHLICYFQFFYILFSNLSIKEMMNHTSSNSIIQRTFHRSTKLVFICKTKSNSYFQHKKCCNESTDVNDPGL